ANRADRMILALSSMLRYTSDNKCELTPLRNDVEWLKKYLTLMNLRYENGFDSVWEIPEALMDLPIPKLFLQPFIENSIVHGFPDREKGGKIVICAREETDKWTFMVSDNGVGIPPERICGLLSEDGRASGMQNVRRRIQLMYGEKEGVTIQACPGGGTRVIIQIPKGSLMI
ncbi:MAG: histidine kinase, partial [Clostridia bacterium]